MVKWLAEILVIAGTFELGYALLPVRRLIAELPIGGVHRQWRIMAGLVGFFIIGYLAYAGMIWARPNGVADLIVAAVFFLGAGFVWLSATLSLRTAADVRRVTLLEQENITDPLVGIYNRRYLDRRIEEEVERARRYHTPLSVLMIDIDHFKHINDAHGHPVGDLVLSYLGKLLLQAIRKPDIAARYGGEELLIIAPQTALPAAASLAERVRSFIENHELVLAGGEESSHRIRITVSIGAAELTPEIADGRDLIRCADEALYRAKLEGRNRTALYSVQAA